jgi:hypothetical protein
VYAATAIGDQLAAREACLRKLVAVLAAEGGNRLVIEQDDSLLERDRSVLYDDVRRAGVADLLTYEHVPARSEPLLWLADTAAWCWTHGPAWRDRIAPAVRTSGSFDSAKPGSPTLRRAAGSLHPATARRCKHATPAGGVKLLALMLTREGTCLAAGPSRRTVPVKSPVTGTATGPVLPDTAACCPSSPDGVDQAVPARSGLQHAGRAIDRPRCQEPSSV